MIIIIIIMITNSSYYMHGLSVAGVQDLREVEVAQAHACATTIMEYMGI